MSIRCRLGFHKWRRRMEPTRKINMKDRTTNVSVYQICKRCESIIHEGILQIWLANPENKWGSAGICYGCKKQARCKYSPEEGQTYSLEWCPIDAFMRNPKVR